MNIRAVFFSVWNTYVPLAVATFLIVSGVFLFAIVRYRQRPGRSPSGREENNRVELAYVAVLLGIASFLIAVSLNANGRVDRTSKPAAMTVDVVGYQWGWRFTYPARHVTVAPARLGARPVMVIPVGTNIAFNVTSTDVIHSFWIPYLRFKIDAFPHHVNSFVTRFTRTGTFVGRCAEYCGVLHYQMDFAVKVVSRSSYTKWISSHRGLHISQATGAAI